MDERQFQKLREIVKFATEHTKYYRELYDKKGISCDSFSSIEELPLIYPDDLIKNPYDFKSEGVSIYKTYMSSGTVSYPKMFFRTLEDYEHSVANEVILKKWAGVTSSDLLCIAQTFGFSSFKDYVFDACKLLGVPTLPLGVITDEILINTIRTSGVSVIEVAPSKFVKLSNDINWKNTNVRLALASGEQLTESMLEIAYKNSIIVLDQYGSTEFDALAGQKIGETTLTMLIDDFIFESIDDRLVVTSLYHKGTPLIRYVLGDRVKIKGKSLEIYGREDSVLLFDGVKLYGEQLESVLSSKCALWQCVVFETKTGVSVQIFLQPLNKDADNLGLESEIENEIINSYDISGYIQSNEISVKCRQTIQFIAGNSHKFIRYVDFREFSVKNLIKLIEAEKFDLFYFYLPSPLSTNLCDSIVKAILSSVPYDKRFGLSKCLIQIWSKKSRKIAGPLFKSCMKENRDELISELEKLAKDVNWEVREEAAKLFAILLLQDFNRNINWINSNLRHVDENIRRASMLALKYACLDVNDIEKLRIMINLLDALLHDRSKYVKKSFDSFTIGDGFLNKCPDVVEKKLDEWMTLNDYHVNCCIIRVFKSSGGTKTWPLAKKYIDYFRAHKDQKLESTLNSCVRYLSKRIPELNRDVQ